VAKLWRLYPGDFIEALRKPINMKSHSQDSNRALPKYKAEFIQLSDNLLVTDKKAFIMLTLILLSYAALKLQALQICIIFDAMKPTHKCIS
jgi:hypothetical protein